MLTTADRPDLLGLISTNYRRHVSIASEIAALRLFEAGLNLGKLPALARNKVADCLGRHVGARPIQF